MQLRDLELFCEVASQRSFSKAAKAFGVSQPAASETVRALEEHLGVTLLNRATRPPELTPAGRVFLEGSREILASYRRLEDRVRQLHNQIVGPVRVAAIYSVGLLQMDSYVRQFERQYPDAVLELRYVRPNEVVEQVLADQVDLGLLSFPPKRADLEVIRWQEQPFVVVVPPAHRLAARKAIQIGEIEGESLVTFTPELQIRSELDRWLAKAGVTVEVVHQFDNIENIKRAVEVESGIALLPLATVRRELEIGSLRALTLEDVDWVRPLGIVHRKHKVLTAAVSRFLDLLHRLPETSTRGRAGVAADGAG